MLSKIYSYSLLFRRFCLPGLIFIHVFYILIFFSLSVKFNGYFGSKNIIYLLIDLLICLNEFIFRGCFFFVVRVDLFLQTDFCEGVSLNHISCISVKLKSDFLLI